MMSCLLAHLEPFSATCSCCCLWGSRVAVCSERAHCSLTLENVCDLAFISKRFSTAIGARSVAQRLPPLSLVKITLRDANTRRMISTFNFGCCYCVTCGKCTNQKDSLYYIASSTFVHPHACNASVRSAVSTDSVLPTFVLR